MDLCPHCQENSITAWSKSNTTSNFPGKCRRCGNRYYASGWGMTALWLSFEFLFWGAIILALVIKHWIGLLVLPVGLAVNIFIFNKAVKPKPISDKEVTKSKIISIAIIFGSSMLYLFMEKVCNEFVIHELILS